MRRETMFVSVVISGAILVAGSWMARGGSLTPPAGPIAATGRFGPRVEISTLPANGTAMHVISQAGSYYLDKNISGVASGNGIEVSASDVTIDLMGFKLEGIGGSSNGIQSIGAITNIVVMNGTIRGWGQNGLLLDTATGGRVEGIHAHGNGNDGIRVLNGFVITKCTATSNGQDGVRGTSFISMSHCAANSNTGIGINVTNRSTITECVANLNNSRGILASDGCTISNCVGKGNQTGIITGGGSTITNSSCADNTLDGITCAGNGTLVVGNACRNNSRGGIRVEGSRNRIEGNHVSANLTGIDILADPNLIIRNSAYDNTTNYSIASGNDYGAIVSGPGAGFSETNPWLNFENAPP